MYIEDCVVPVKLGDKNRITLPRVMNIGSNLDFYLYRNRSSAKKKVFLVPHLITDSFEESYDHKVEKIISIPQDKFRRIRIPAYCMKFMPKSKELWLFARNDIIEISDRSDA